MKRILKVFRGFKYIYEKKIKEKKIETGKIYELYLVSHFRNHTSLLTFLM